MSTRISGKQDQLTVCIPQYVRSPLPKIHLSAAKPLFLLPQLPLQVLVQAKVHVKVLVSLIMLRIVHYVENTRLWGLLFSISSS